jgi:hypothetical protein
MGAVPALFAAISGLAAAAYFFCAHVDNALQLAVVVQGQLERARGLLKSTDWRVRLERTEQQESG